MAGCTSGGEEAKAVALDDASFGAETGALRLSVTDEEVRPVPNATARLWMGAAAEDNVPLERRTAADGRAAFSELAPGTYSLGILALGFEPLLLAVDVRAAALTDVSTMLVRLPYDGPYHETTTASGLVRSIVWRVGPACDTVVQPPLGTCLGFQAQDVTVRVPLTPDWATVVDEAAWTPNTAGFHQRAYVFATFPNVSDFSGVPDFKSPGHFEAGGTSPVVLWIERQTLYDRGFPESNHYGGARGTRFRHVNNFDDVSAANVVSAGVMIDQPMDAFITVFHQEPAPPGFTALADA